MRKGRGKIKKCEYLEKKKSFLGEIKSIFYSFLKDHYFRILWAEALITKLETNFTEREKGTNSLNNKLQQTVSNQTANKDYELKIYEYNKIRSQKSEIAP